MKKIGDMAINSVVNWSFKRQFIRANHRLNMILNHEHFEETEALFQQKVKADAVPTP
jgi:hypothetical protein